MKNGNSPQIAAQRSGVIRVFVVDDHEVVRRGLRSIFRKTPQIALVGEATDGEEALRKMLEIKPDVALVDIRLPDSDGFAIAREVIKQQPETRIIMLTGYDSVLYISEALSLGVRGFISKDCSRDLMVSAIKVVAGGGTVWEAGPLFNTLKHISQMSRIGLPETIDSLQSEHFSQREIRILKLISEGQTNKQIALVFQLSPDAIKKSITKIMAKLGVTSRMEAAVSATQRGYLNL